MRLPPVLSGTGVGLGTVGRQARARTPGPMVIAQLRGPASRGNRDSESSEGLTIGASLSKPLAYGPGHRDEPPERTVKDSDAP